MIINNNISSEDYKNLVRRAGADLLDNMVTANNFAAGEHCAVVLHPARKYVVSAKGGIVDQLKDDCGPPSPDLRKQFNVSIHPETPAQDSTNPSLASLLSPNPKRRQ